MATLEGYPLQGILIAGDLFFSEQVTATGFLINRSWRENFAEALWQILRLPLAKACGLPVRLLERSGVKPEVERCHAALAGAQTLFTPDHYATLLGAEPRPEDVAAFAPFFSGQFVAGLDMSPFMLRLLDALDIPWINLTTYPLYCLPDLTFSFASNVVSIREQLLARSLSRETVEMAVALEKARYTPNIHDFHNRLPENTLLALPPPGHSDFFPARDNRRLSGQDLSALLRELAPEHPHILAYWTDQEPHSPALRRILRETGARPLPLVSRHRPLSMFLAHPAIASVAGLGGKQLVQAALFGKKAKGLFPLPARFTYVDALPVEPGSPEYLPLGDLWLKPDFWRALLAPCLRNKAAPSDPGDVPAPNLRLVFRGGGGDFDDAASYMEAARIGSLEAQMRVLRQFVREQAVAENGIRRHRGTHRPSSTKIPPPGQRYAAFAVGDSRYAAPSVVALKSLHCTAASAISSTFPIPTFWLRKRKNCCAISV
jgi:hypothetical protein